MGDPLVIDISMAFSRTNADGVTFTGYNNASSVSIYRFEPGAESASESWELTHDEYEAFRKQVPELNLPVLKPRKPGTNANGNTVGKVVGEAPSAAVPASQANPPVKAETEAEKGVGGQILDGLQIGLDVAGLVPGFGEFADLANAGISAARGDYVGATLSLAAAIPFAGWGATAAKGVKRGVDIAQTGAETGAKVGKEVAEETADQAGKHGDEVAEAGGKGGKGGKVKSKKKMKCGEYGRYGKQKQKTGEGKFDRDHIPSKAALKERAKTLLPKGKKLSPKQAKAIDNWGETIAVPRQAHIDVSPTFGQSIADAATDAKNLAGSARRDVEAMLKKIDEYDADGGCKKAYQKAAARVLRMDNAAYDEALKKILKTVK